MASERGEPGAARAPAVVWIWIGVVAATALGSAWTLHGIFRAVSLAGSAFAVFTLVRRLRPGGAAPSREDAP